MRTENEMMSLILGKAKEDERIRAVMMNGSRVNPNVKKDRYQDYDIVYVVRDVDSFTSDHSWVDLFGERILMQMPDDMFIPPAENDGSFAYLMLFKDGNRIDLTLVPAEQRGELMGHDSLSEILLDKDHLFEALPPANDSDYHVKKPSAKQLADCSNEFWWCMTNVAKGLCREELPYAKSLMENPVRDMLITALSWHVGTKTDFSVSTGKFGKALRRYLDEETWERFVSTYADGNLENMWDALFNACSLFSDVSHSVADHCGYELEDEEKVLSYLKRMKI